MTVFLAKKTISDTRKKSKTILRCEKVKFHQDFVNKYGIIHNINPALKILM